MNTKHTPGPWHFYTNPITKTSVVAFRADGPPIGKAISTEDARLIAAAPELLEALQRLLAESDLYANEHRPKLTACCEFAKQAIAKATGGKE